MMGGGGEGGGGQDRKRGVNDSFYIMSRIALNHVKRIGVCVDENISNPSIYIEATVSLLNE